jgi:hypothetical protein
MKDMISLSRSTLAALVHDALLPPPDDPNPPRRGPRGPGPGPQVLEGILWAMLNPQPIPPGRDVSLNPQPIPPGREPIHGPHGPWVAMFQAREVIQRAQFTAHLAATLERPGLLEDASRQIAAFVDLYCPEPRPKPPLPPDWALLAAGAQFQLASEAEPNKAIRSELEKGATRLFEVALERQR